MRLGVFGGVSRAVRQDRALALLAAEAHDDDAADGLRRCFHTMRDGLAQVRKWLESRLLLATLGEPAADDLALVDAPVALTAADRITQKSKQP